MVRILEKERQRSGNLKDLTNPTRLISDKYIKLIHKIPFFYIINNWLEMGKLPFITTKAMKCLQINGAGEDSNHSKEQRGTPGQKV